MTNAHDLAQGKTIDDLRDHLFATLAALRDPTNPMDIDRAKAVSLVAGTIIASAKVEVEHIRVTGTGKSGFIPEERATKTIEGPPQSGLVSVTRHLCK